MTIIICLLNTSFFFIQNSSSGETTQNPEQSYLTNDIIFERITEIGSWELNLGNVDNVIVEGDLAYIGGGDCTLIIVNISNFDNLEVIGTYDSGSIYTTNLYLKESILFISKGSSGFEVINVSNPYKPVRLYQQSYYYVREIAVSDNYLFATDSYMDLRVFDISDLSYIQYITSINIGASGSFGLKYVDHYIFLANGIEGLKIYDVEDPLHPVLAGYNNSYGASFFEISIQNNICYLIDIDNNIITFDVSNVSNPIYLGNYTGQDYDDFFVEDNFIYLIGKNMGLEILNCTNPANITSIYSLSFYGEPTSIFKKEHNLFIADWINCLKIIDVSNKTQPIQIRNFGNGELIESFIYNNCAYLVDSQLGLIILNITDPANPKKISSYKDEGFITSVYVVEDLAFISISENGFKILNITDISNPAVLSHFYDGGYAYDIYASSSRVYLADGDDGLEIYDITNVLAPVKIGSSYFSSPSSVSFSAHKMIIESGFAYVIDYSEGLFVIEIRDTENMGLIYGYIEDNLFYDCIIANGLCYIACGSGIRIYDISDPENILYKNSISYSYVFDLKLINQDYLLSTGNTGLRLVNIEYAQNPSIINSYEIEGAKVDIGFYKDNVILINSDNAPDFQVVRLDGDLDGLSDLEEFLYYNTYPNNADSDNDQLLDGDEIHIYGTNPRNSDTDGDGLGDGFEVSIGTDPTNSDTDDDGYSDGYEYHHGSDPLDPNSVPRFQIWMAYVAIILITSIIVILLITNIVRRIKGKK
ncbi:MAG: hypothetical protein JXA54_05750 [Candidatus Heimdallarchaeota archaeon]|nr:hypothetical protein [Candidatus Heimdallarchaeota archaeon]